MDMVFSILKYTFFGFLALIALLVVGTLLFCKRFEKRWEYEAKFRNDKGRELGEFDIKSSRIKGENTDFELRAKFVLRHDALSVGSVIEVFLENVLVMSGSVNEAGRIRLRNEHLKRDIDNPAAGQICAVRCGGIELFSEALYVD